MHNSKSIRMKSHDQKPEDPHLHSLSLKKEQLALTPLSFPEEADTVAPTTQPRHLRQHLYVSIGRVDAIRTERNRPLLQIA